MSYPSVYTFPGFSEYILVSGHWEKKLTFGVV